MKHFTQQNKSVIGVLVLALVAMGWIAIADYRQSAQTFLESTWVGANANVGVHTPVVTARVDALSASVSSLFTSSTSAMDFDTATTITTAFDLLGVRVHLSAASSTQTLYLYVDSGAGTEFDVALLAEATDTADTVFRPSTPETFRSVDALRVVYANANAATVGFEIRYRIPQE